MAMKMMEKTLPLLGLVRVTVVRGFNLARRDLLGSDPYVLLSISHQRVKTKVIKRNLNPEWNEDLTLYVIDPSHPIKLEVFDKDTFSRDDPMGNGVIDIQPLVESGIFEADTMLDGHIIKVVHPTLKNQLVGESKIYFYNGKVVQDMILRLKDVECGELELKLEWTSAISCKK
ncbi:GTPase activating protein 1-like [Wolffia australiana]